MVWRWLLSLLYGLSALFVVGVPTLLIVGTIDVPAWVGLGAPLGATVAGMWVAYRTAPTLKWLSAALVPTPLFALVIWFLWALSNATDLP